MTKDWYSPGEIHFSRRTALWLIQNLEILRDGRWPPEASNYIDIFSKTTSHKASFVTPVEYAAEISARMEKCGIDGLILLAMEAWGESQEALAKYLWMPEWSINKRANRALAYVSSGPARRWHNTPKRKGGTYQEFKRRKKK